MLGSKIKVDLVGSNAKAPDDNQILCFAENLFAQLRLGSDSDDVYIAVVFDQLCFGLSTSPWSSNTESS